MKILIPYFSRSGHTERLALVLAAELEARGHAVTLEKISVQQRRSKWHLTLPLLSSLPVLPLILWVTPFRHWWLRHYRQAEQEIAPLSFPDVEKFDRICIGGPKWLYIAYPVARYLNKVQGLRGKKVGVFATFCGPPLEVFELALLFTPLQHRLEARDANLIATLAISSQAHEFFFFNEMEYVFRLVCRLRFRRALHMFGLDSVWGQQEIRRYCDALEMG